MEREVTTEKQTEKTPPEKRFLFHAVIKAQISATGEPDLVHLTAEKWSELTSKIDGFHEPKIIVLVKGRELKFKETRQLRLI